MVDDATVEIEVQSSREFGIEGSLETWVCGQIEGHDNPVEVIVTNEHGNMQFLRPVARLEDGGWHHVSEFGRRDGRFRFVIPASGGAPVDFASWWPYLDSDHEQLLNHMRQQPSVSVEQLGATARGRPIHGVTVHGNRDAPTVAIVSGFHGGEPSAFWAMDALLRFLTSPAGTRLRERATVVSVPLVNRDAVAEGLDRRNAQGINLWLDAEARDAPEITAVDPFLSAAQPAAIVDIHSWHWRGDGCYTPGWLSAGDRLYDRILALRDAIDRSFPLGGQLFFSDDLDCWLTRMSVELAVPSIDPEISLSQGSDGAWKTLDRARDDGVAILRAVAQFVQGAH